MFGLVFGDWLGGFGVDSEELLLVAMLCQTDEPVFADCRPLARCYQAGSVCAGIR